MKRLLLAATLGGALLAALPTSLSAGLIDAKTNIFVAGQDSTGINTVGRPVSRCRSDVHSGRGTDGYVRCHS